MCILCALIVYYCWPLILVAAVAYQLITNSDRFDAIPNQLRRRYSALPETCKINLHAAF